MGKAYNDKQTIPPIGEERYPGQNRPEGYPEGCKTETGYGCTAADVQRGYVEVEGLDNPERDLANYKNRWTAPKTSDEDTPFGFMGDDYEFRQKNRQSKGLFMRPRIPTER